MRRAHTYFKREEGAPAPLVAKVSKIVQFGEVDLLGIVWHGRYPGFFEEANAALGKRYGLDYESMRFGGVAAPIAQLHIDYHKPLSLSESFTVQASLIWDEGARLNMEYSLTGPDGSEVCTGYTIQTFISLETRQALWLSPQLLERCRTKWQAGEFDV